MADEMVDERGGSQGGMDENCSDADAGLTPMSSLCVVSIPSLALELGFHKVLVPLNRASKVEASLGGDWLQHT